MKKQILKAYLEEKERPEAQRELLNFREEQGEGSQDEIDSWFYS